MQDEFQRGWAKLSKVAVQYSVILLTDAKASLLSVFFLERHAEIIAIATSAHSFV